MTLKDLGFFQKNVYTSLKFKLHLKNQEKKLVFLDLNGVVFDTHLDSNGVLNLNPHAIEAIRYLRDRNYYIVVWTAASKNIIKEIKKYPELEELIDFVITREDYDIQDKKKREKVINQLYKQSNISFDFPDFDLGALSCRYSELPKLFMLLSNHALLIDDGSPSDNILVNDFKAIRKDRMSQYIERKTLYSYHKLIAPLYWTVLKEGDHNQFRRFTLQFLKECEI